jgi:hypothetical protein
VVIPDRHAGTSSRRELEPSVDPSVELRRCVQALAQPATIQVSLFPDFVCVCDELALEFDAALRAFRATNAVMSPSEETSLVALDAYLDELSGPENQELWDTARLESDVRWERIRVLARAILTAFSWPDEVPAKNGAIYVAAGRVNRNGRVESE